jgi:hypothetical protein
MTEEQRAKYLLIGYECAFCIHWTEQSSNKEFCTLWKIDVNRKPNGCDYYKKYKEKMTV